jgi:hypothetical protein
VVSDATRHRLSLVLTAAAFFLGLHGKAEEASEESCLPDDLSEASVDGDRVKCEQWVGLVVCG